MKFTRAWDRYLRHAFLFRSKESTSGKWYAEKKLGFTKSALSHEQTVFRIMPQLKDLRATCLATPFKHAKFKNEVEYRAASFKKEFGGSEGGGESDGDVHGGEDDDDF